MKEDPVSEMVERVARGMCRSEQERLGYTETIPNYEALR